MLLADRLQIEVIAGEMADVMERIRYGCLEHRSHNPNDPKSLKLTRFPSGFDRIHMSNIPDYVGGPLGSHLCGGPLLRNGRNSNLRFNNLLNPPMFKDHTQFLAEYMLMYDAEQVTHHFGLVREKDPPNDPAEEQRITQLRLSLDLNEFFSEDYFIWRRSGIKCMPRSKMMSRPALEHWLYSHLLKICLPYKRPARSDSPVHAPLNLTLIFMLVTLLHEVRYPAHWLSGVVCSPFGIIAPSRSLVPTSDIVQCSIKFPSFPHSNSRSPHTVLVFFNMKVSGDKRVKLPDMLQDDEEGDTSEFAAAVRKEGVHMVTAFNYVTKTRTATLWMRKDVVEEVMEGPWWEVGVCRTEMWHLIRESIVSPADVLETLGPWT